MFPILVICYCFLVLKIECRAWWFLSFYHPLAVWLIRSLAKPKAWRALALLGRVSFSRVCSGYVFYKSPNFRRLPLSELSSATTRSRCCLYHWLTSLVATVKIPNMSQLWKGGRYPASVRETSSHHDGESVAAGPSECREQAGSEFELWNLKLLLVTRLFPQAPHPKGSTVF